MLEQVEGLVRPFRGASDGLETIQQFPVPDPLLESPEDEV